MCSNKTSATKLESRPLVFSLVFLLPLCWLGPDGPGRRNARRRFFTCSSSTTSFHTLSLLLPCISSLQNHLGTCFNPPGSDAPVVNRTHSDTRTFSNQHLLPEYLGRAHPHSYSQHLSLGHMGHGPRPFPSWMLHACRSCLGSGE